jgi:hypothetical protein
MHQVKFTPCVLAAIISVLFVANAKAVPITYTESATVSGSIAAGGLVGSFTNALLTLTATGDTANVQQVSGTFFNNVTASFTLSGGLGGGTFTDSIAVLVVQSCCASFGDNNQLSIILSTDSNTAFASYALATSIGPITGPSTISSGFSFPTSVGALIIDTAGDATFTAVVTPVVPLPGALPLFATGLGALGLLAWRRKRKAAPDQNS